MTYWDDVPHTNGNSFDYHIKYPEAILKVLKKAGMQVNAKKSTWCATALQFFSLLITGYDYRPLKSQVKAICNCSTI